MRRAVLILPLLALVSFGACTAKPANESLAMVSNGEEENVAAPTPAPTLSTVAGEGPPCAKLRDPCRMGQRGTPTEKCFEITAYLYDPTPGGRAVYARPDERSRVLGRVLEPWKGDHGAEWAVPFRVIDSNGGWIRIEGAGDDEGLLEQKGRPMYHGKGWIRGEGVRVTLQGSQVFTAPDWESPMAFQVLAGGGEEGKGWLEEHRMLALTACDGSWVQGRWRIDDPAKVRPGPGQPPLKLPGELTGWATGVCEIQETTCDGLFGDKPGTY